jgi:glycosyltransferase involved in cell wall biosynthesis
VPLLVAEKSKGEMETRSPKVSVGFPVYNGEKYLANALTRLLEQDFQDFELVICDNASTDRTQEICQEFAGKDPRIRYFRNPINIGLAANHNRTFELSRGQYFKHAAHDDDFPPTMLSRFVSVFEQGPPTIAVVYSYCEYIDEAGNVIGMDTDHVDKYSRWPHRRLSHLLRNIHMYNCPYGLIRSDMFRRTRGYGLFPGADHVLCAELAMLGRFVEIPEPLLRIRRHPGRTFDANKTEDSLLNLFDPDHKERHLIRGVQARMKVELIRSGFRVPRTLRDKVLCTAVAIVKPQWETFRAFGGRQKRKLRQVFSPIQSLS